MGQKGTPIVFLKLDFPNPFPFSSFSQYLSHSGLTSFMSNDGQYSPAAVIGLIIFTISGQTTA